MLLLPYLHPAWQIAALLVGLWALRQALRMRGLRLRRLAECRAPLVGPHARAGLVFAGLLAAGYVAGPLTLALVRQGAVFRSAHAFFATLTLLTVLLGAWLGWRLWRGHGGAGLRDLHAWCMGVALFLSLVAAALGLALLP